MAEDPTALRFRTYLWFPVLTIGTVLLLTVTAAAGEDSGALDLLLFFSLAGLYVSAILGIHGLLRDVASLQAAQASWQPAWQRYIGAGSLIAAGLTIITVFPPATVTATQPLGPVGVAGAIVISLTLTSGPVCLAYLLVRWRRMGLNYISG